MLLGEWKEVKGTGKERSDFGITAMNENLFVIGGLNEDDLVTGKNEVFHLRKNKWEIRSSLPTPRA